MFNHMIKVNLLPGNCNNGNKVRLTSLLHQDDSILLVYRNCENAIDVVNKWLRDHGFTVMRIVVRQDELHNTEYCVTVEELLRLR